MANGSTDIDRDLLDSLGGIVWEADPETLQFTSVGPNAEALLGYPQSAWTSNPTFWTDSIHPDDRQRALDTRVQALKRCDHHRVEYRVHTADGRTRWIRDSARLECESGRPTRLYGVMIDVTASRDDYREIVDRQQTESALVESERAFTSTFDEAPIGIAHTSLEGRWIRVNRRLCELLGYAPDELKATSFLAVTHPNDVDQDVRALSQLLAGAIGKYERDKRYRHKDGHFVSAKLTAVLHRDSTGTPRYFISIIEDVTDRVRLEAQLRQAQKMEALGRLTGSIVHDFNNLLTAIIGFSELALPQLAPDTQVHRDVEGIRHAGTSAAALTRQLLAFSRKQILQPQILDLNGIVSRVNALLGRLSPENVTLVMNLAAPLGRVCADPDQIEQVVMNLVMNARDAMPDGGRVTVETANADLDEDYAAQHPGATAGPHVVVAVSDTGTGMDEATQKRLFEPFFTTKPRGKGTGLGLATVYGIVKQSAGSIFVDSEPGHGTTFKVFLPRTDQPADLADAPARQSIGGSETILIVEDQPDVRAVTQKTLARHGYRVLEAANGAEALSILADYDGELHLLLIDVVTPGMSGRELAEQLVAVRPELLVLYTSGHADDTIVHNAALEAGMAFIQKPFTPDALLQKVRDLLDGR